MKAKSLFQWMVRVLLMIVIAGNSLAIPNQAVSAKPLLGAFTNYASQTQIPAVEYNALVALYNSTDGEHWANNTGWMQTDTPCSWYGVICGWGTNVTSLALNINQLSGSIPPELGSLSNLLYLGLGNNQLTGSIPPQLGSLTNLTWLYLGSSQLSGSIPPELGNLTNLTHLDLAGNQLSGSIPPELGNLSNLTHLGLGTNQLSGSIPPQLGNLSNLTYLNFASNQLSGSIPPELGSLTNLSGLALHVNQLTGSIPTELGNLTNLTWLWLSSNQLSGSIPPELGNLTNLTSLWLYGNQLTGSIPPELGNLTNLTVLYLYGNQLTGSIPTELGNLTNLTSLWLSSNQLSGEFPASITNLVNLSSFTFDTFDCGLTSSDPAVIAFIENLVPGWQTQCALVFYNVTPNNGPASGGTNVTISGAKFTDASSVTFGGTEAASFTVDNDWQITATSPAHAGGAVDLVVTTPKGVGTATSAFTYSSAFAGCASVSQIPPPECDALVALYNDTDGANWADNTGWLQTDTPCSWYGVNCVYGTVFGLDLSYNQLTGSIPPELGNLTQLQDLYLNDTQLTGEIPVSFTNLTSLINLTLSCGLTSTDPAVISFIDGILGAGWDVACGPPTNITLSKNSVAENKPIGTLVGMLSTTDPDAGDTFTYSFACAAPGANDSSFAIAGNNLNTAASFNFEVKKSYAICVRTTDSGGLFFDKNFTVTVTDVNEETAKNGGFNLYPAGKKVPTSWVSTQFATTDGKDTAVKKEGAASVKIAGATGKVKTLTQTLTTLSGAMGDTFTFSYWVKANKFPTAGLCQAQVLFYSGATLKDTKTLKCPTGATYNWKQAKLSFTAPAAYTKVVIKFTFSKASGSVWFDLVSLLR